MLHANIACGSTWRKPRGEGRKKRHTNPFDDAQVIISSTVLAGSLFIMPLVALCVFGLFGFWFCLCFVCFGFCFVFCFSFGIVMAPLDRVKVLQQQGLFLFIFSPRWQNFQLLSLMGNMQHAIAC